MTWQENYNRRTKEANIDYWQDQGLLEGISDPHIKMVTALMLQNQKLCNEQIAPELVVKDSLKIVSKIVPNLLIHQLVSVQPKLGPNDVVFYNRYRYAKPEDAPESEERIHLVVESEDNVCKTRKLKTFWADDPNIDELAAQVVQEIDNEVLNDLYNNCGTIASVDKDASPEQLSSALAILSDRIRKKCLLNWKSWVVINENVVGKFTIPAEFKVHVVKNMTPYLLMGIKGDQFYQSGYQWCPYIMLAKTPHIPDSTFLPGYLIRYGKKLLREGAKHFGKFTWKKEEVKC
jgi:hypothetical protein